MLAKLWCWLWGHKWEKSPFATFALMVWCPRCLTFRSLPPLSKTKSKQPETRNDDDLLRVRPSDDRPLRLDEKPQPAVLSVHNRVSGSVQ
jgi:hypothetical protein